MTPDAPADTPPSLADLAEHAPPATRPPQDPFLEHRMAQARADVLKRQKRSDEAALRKRLRAELQRALETPLIEANGQRDLGAIASLAEERATAAAIKHGSANPYTGRRLVRRPRRPREDATEATE